MHNVFICIILNKLNAYLHKQAMQPQGHFDRILDICKSFSQNLFNSSGNLFHCGQSTLCSDVEVVAIALTQEYCSIDSERRFFEELKTMLTEQYLKLGSRRNYTSFCLPHRRTQAENI